MNNFWTQLFTILAIIGLLWIALMAFGYWVAIQGNYLVFCLITTPIMGWIIYMTLRGTFNEN